MLNLLLNYAILVFFFCHLGIRAHSDGTKPTTNIFKSLVIFDLFILVFFSSFRFSFAYVTEWYVNWPRCSTTSKSNCCASTAATATKIVTQCTHSNCVAPANQCGYTDANIRCWCDGKWKSSQIGANTIGASTTIASEHIQVNSLHLSPPLSRIII